MMQLSFPSMAPALPACQGEPVEPDDIVTIEAKVSNAGDCYNAAYGWYLGRGDTPELAVKDLVNRIEKEQSYRG